MVLKLLDSAALDFFKDKKFIEAEQNKFSNYTDCSWLSESFGRDPFIETRFKVGDLHFNMSAPERKEHTTEYENVKELYSKLRFLSDSNASEERLWAGLCLSEGYAYTQYRWRNSLNNVSGILDHFFFNSGNRRAYTRNAMARLWWIGRLTYDERNPTDPWHLTKFVCEGSDYVFHFLERTTSNNMTILRPFLTSMLEARDSGIEINTDDAGELAKELNILGASYALDFLPEEWIKDKMHQIILDYASKKSNTQNTIEEGEHYSEETSSAGQDDIIIKASNVVKLLRKADGKYLVVNAKGNGFRMTPASLVGMKKGNRVKIGKFYYEIYGIK